MQQGHIKISRKMFAGEDALWEDGTAYDSRSAWIWLIQHAAFKPYVYRGVDPLERGEFVASVRFLAERFGWSKSAVQRWIARVEKAGRIAGQRMGHLGKIYRIVKYDAYQSGERAGGTASGTRTGTEAGQVRDKQESSKAIKQNYVYPPEFDRLWSVYPKRAGDNPKREAFEKYAASIKRGVEHRAIEDGLHRYAKFCEATNLIGTRFVKQGATFFGLNESWTDPWDIPLTVSRGGQSDAIPNASDGWYGPGLEEATRPAGVRPWKSA